MTLGGRSVDVADRALDVTLRQSGPIPLDISFRCSPGQVLAPFGPSGSGKTTMLRSIAGAVLAHARSRLDRGGDVAGHRHWREPAALSAPGRIRLSGLRPFSASDGAWQLVHLKHRVD